MLYGLTALALLGHVALCVAAINRFHAVGLTHRWLRVVNLVWYLVFLGVPAGVGCWYLASTISPDDSWVSWPVTWLVGLYVVITCIAAVIAVGHVMLRWRHFPTTSRLLTNHTTHVDFVEELGHRPVGDRVIWLASYFPGNEILRLLVHEKTIALARLPSELEGMTIAHVSDLHLTGQLTPPFFQEIVRRTNDLDADIVAITGDLIDSKRCLSWMPEIFGKLRSRYGAFYVLGNHDQRLPADSVVRQLLADSGLIHLGGRWNWVDLRGTRIVLAGNELPWYAPAADMQDCPERLASGRPFRIALSHCPDQIHWARAQDFDLMLAGHTHGGQCRFPVVGPILSPSRYGVRFASGTFFLEPTLLHVSRGISGTRPLRLGCPPELAKLTLVRG